MEDEQVCGTRLNAFEIIIQCSNPVGRPKATMKRVERYAEYVKKYYDPITNEALKGRQNARIDAGKTIGMSGDRANIERSIRRDISKIEAETKCVLIVNQQIVLVFVDPIISIIGVDINLSGAAWCIDKKTVFHNAIEAKIKMSKIHVTDDENPLVQYIKDKKPFVLNINGLNQIAVGTTISE